MNNRTVTPPSKKSSYIFIVIAVIIVGIFVFQKEIVETWNNRNQYIELISKKYKNYKTKSKADKLEENRTKPKLTPKEKEVLTGASPVIKESLEKRRSEPVKNEVFDFSMNTPEKNTELLKNALSRKDYNIKKIRALLEAGANPNGKTYHHMIFADAVQSDAPVEVLRLLLEKGGDLKYKNYERNNLLTLAAYWTENPEIIAFLAEQGFECSDIRYGKNQLHVAAQYNENVDVVKEFTRVCQSNSQDEFGNNALFFALENNKKDNAEIFDMLVSEGVPVNVKNNQGSTLLTKAAEKGAKLSVFLTLIEAGVNVNDVTTEYEKNALHYIYKIDDPIIIKTLIDAGIDVNQISKSGKETPLHIAVANNKSPEIISLLIEAGANVNAKGNYEDTPLHIAAKKSNNKVIDLLINAGADQNAKNYYEQTPLMLAVSKSRANEEDIKSLIQGDKIDINMKKRDGATALFEAVAYNADFVEVIKPIVEKGADVKVMNNNGTSILKKAISRGVNTDTVKYLIENGADAKEQGLVFEAFSQGAKFDIIATIIRAGADLKTVDKSGYTPLARALNRNLKADVIGVMIDYGADVNAKLPNGLSMLELAKSKYKENDEVISLLIASGAK